LDFAKFVSLLDKSALYFCRADKFVNDPFEGATGYKAMKDFWEQKEREFITSKIRQGCQQSEQPVDESELPKEAERFVTGQRDIRQLHETRRTFITFWHLNADESDAMWQIYSRRNQYMVALKTTVQRLDKALGEYSDNEIGEVNYVDYKTAYPQLGHQFWYKRHSFAHEREVRAIIKMSSDINAEGILEPVQLDFLIEEIVLGPESPGWFEEIVKSIALKYNQNLLIRSSNMNAEPFF
jgi:restriction endonuclease